MDITPPGVIFQTATGNDTVAVAQVQASLRRRILRAFVGRGLIETVDAKDKLAQRTHWREAKAAIQTCCEAALRVRLSASRLAPKGVAKQVPRRFKLSGIGDALTGPTQVLLELKRLKFLSAIIKPGLGFFDLMHQNAFQPLCNKR